MIPYGYITVRDRITALGYEPTNALSWMVGAQVREAYRASHGSLPPKQLAKKKDGAGSHCFAYYPADMGANIDAIIRTVAAALQAAAARQQDLFS